MLPGSAGVLAGNPYGELISQRRSSTSRWYHFDALGSTDRLTGADEGGTLTTFSYDANGNTTGENANGALTTNAWDDENRLKVLTPSSGDPATMSYDATGLRRTRAVGTATTRFIWDGQKIILETDGDGTTQVQYTLNLGTYGDLISQRRSSTSRWYHFDALGSTDRLTGSDGSATDTYIYRAFGPLAASTGSTTNPFRYVGKLGYYDQGSGPLYVRARWLRPTTGSWLSVDPVDGEPRYAYASGEPVLDTDTSGMWTVGDECGRDKFEIGEALRHVGRTKWSQCVGEDLRSCMGDTLQHLEVRCVEPPHESCGGTDPPTMCGCTPFEPPGVIVICKSSD